jgi:hypothetical protein
MQVGPDIAEQVIAEYDEIVGAARERSQAPLFLVSKELGVTPSEFLRVARAHRWPAVDPVDHVLFVDALTRIQLPFRVGAVAASYGLGRNWCADMDLVRCREQAVRRVLGIEISFSYALSDGDTRPCIKINSLPDDPECIEARRAIEIKAREAEMERIAKLAADHAQRLVELRGPPL